MERHVVGGMTKCTSDLSRSQYSVNRCSSRSAITMCNKVYVSTDLIKPTGQRYVILPIGILVCFKERL